MTPTARAVAWTVLIVVACLVPGSSLPGVTFVPFSVDKWVHVGMFVGFGALWLAACPGRTWAVVGWGLALAVAIEVWQGALPIGRSPDPFDALADAVGLALGVGLALAVRRAAEGNDGGGPVSR